jgi:hypothetical protein
MEGVGVRHLNLPTSGNETREFSPSLPPSWTLRAYQIRSGGPTTSARADRIPKRTILSLRQDGKSKWGVVEWCKRRTVGVDSNSRVIISHTPMNS